MKQTMVKKYNEKACDPFAMNQVMDYGSAKGFIDDAYEKRKIVRKAVKVCRESNLEGEMMAASYFCAVAKKCNERIQTSATFGRSRLSQMHDRHSKI